MLRDGLTEWRDECSCCTVQVNRDVIASVLFELVEIVIVGSSYTGHYKPVEEIHDEDPNRVLVDVLLHELGIKSIVRLTPTGRIRASTSKYLAVFSRATW